MWTDTRYNYQRFTYLVLVTKKMGIFVGCFLLCFLVSGVTLKEITDGVGTYIIGGQDVEKGQFPWQIRLESGTKFCGGTILSDRFVMTAAHCITEDPTSYSVIAGDQDLEMEEETEQRVGVIEAYVYKKYDFNKKVVNDIALLKLDAPLIWSEGVWPTVLSDANFDELALGNPECWVVGYGFTSQDPYTQSRYLQKLKTNVITNKDCNDYYRNVHPRVWKKNVCTWTDVGSSCFGDSGGYLGCYGEDNVFRQVGIVSWALSDCTAAPTVYTRVSEYRDWITDKMDMTGR